MGEGSTPKWVALVFWNQGLKPAVHILVLDFEGRGGGMRGGGVAILTRRLLVFR